MKILNEDHQPWQPLHRTEVIKAVERKYPVRVPLVHASWWGEGLEEQYGDRLDQLKRYPEDVEKLALMGIRWRNLKSNEPRYLARRN